MKCFFVFLFLILALNSNAQTIPDVREGRIVNIREFVNTADVDLSEYEFSDSEQLKQMKNVVK
ncbi:MAG: hypothetical protein NE327_22140, partial [Lentisphaeraceae bacterium]|nr:hypothetical protein [Lentisphaeraceae bacterium]